jgi:hypothetical protein
MSPNRANTSRTASPPSGRKRLSAKQLQMIHDGIDKAGLGGFRLATLHLAPATAASTGRCHAQQLPNGHWVIICD